MFDCVCLFTEKMAASSVWVDHIATFWMSSGFSLTANAPFTLRGNGTIAIDGSAAFTQGGGGCSFCLIAPLILKLMFGWPALIVAADALVNIDEAAALVLSGGNATVWGSFGKYSVSVDS